jgi:acetyl esterase
MLFPLSAIKGIAPALIVLAECDVLSDEVEAYANHLLQAGVSVEIWKAQGTVHSFLLDNALAGSIPTQEALQVVCTKLSEVLRPGAGSWSPPLVLHHLRSQLGRDNATQNA